MVDRTRWYAWILMEFSKPTFTSHRGALAPMKFTYLWHPQIHMDSLIMKKDMKSSASSVAVDQPRYFGDAHWLPTLFRHRFFWGSPMGNIGISQRAMAIRHDANCNFLGEQSIDSYENQCETMIKKRNNKFLLVLLWSTISIVYLKTSKYEHQQNHKHTLDADIDIKHQH